MTSTIILTFHRNLAQLAQSLPAARQSKPQSEILIAADGAVEDCRPLAAASAARVIHVPGPCGPAVARNRAAAQASGEVLLFIDADVVVAPGALDGLLGVLTAEPGVAAAFGAYDLHPPESNFMSQYKNLYHARRHETGNREAATFWAGLGAVRADAFRHVGGFNEGFRRPSVEDVDLGCRLRRAGYRVRLDSRFRGRHLKRWTWWSATVSDIRDRGIPWIQLLYTYGPWPDDLNTQWALRLSVGLAYLLLASVIAAAAIPVASLAAAAALFALLALNRHDYAWFSRQRGGAFAARAVPAHVFHHLCNGVSFVVGTALHVLARLGVRLPGALPIAR